MMMLSHGALSKPASDFAIDDTGNAVLNDGIAPAFNNNIGLLIDQSQTYGSHPTTNVLVRQYDANGIVTGKLITGAEDGNGSDRDLATFADMKVNAARLGIELIDMDVLNAPMIKADAVGKITFTPQQTVMYRSDLSIAAIGRLRRRQRPVRAWTQADADANLCLQSQVGYARRPATPSSPTWATPRVRWTKWASRCCRWRRSDPRSAAGANITRRCSPRTTSPATTASTRTPA